MIFPRHILLVSLGKALGQAYDLLLGLHPIIFQIFHDTLCLRTSKFRAKWSAS